MKPFFQFKNQLRALTMVVALVIIWFIFDSITQGAFLQARNLSNLMRQMAITGILAGGMVLVIVMAHIDLSVGSTAAFFGGLLAVLSTQQGYSPTTAFFMTLLAGLAVGSLQGFLVAYKNIPSFIVTLGGMMIFRGASMWITQSSTIPLSESWILTAGAAYVDSRSGWILTGLAILFVFFLLKRNWIRSLFVSLLLAGTMWVFSSHEGIPVPVLLMFGVVILLHFLANHTIWGRHVFALGGNPEAAFLSGVPVRARTLSVFAVMGTLASLGGMVLTSRVGSASPDAGQLLELDAIAACVIGGTSLMGGKGNIFGAIIGALLIESLNNGMSLANMEAYWQYIIKGMVLVGAVFVDIRFRKD